MLLLAAFCDAGGGGLVAPPISVRACTAVDGCGGWVGCIWIVYTCSFCRDPATVLQPVVYGDRVHCLWYDGVR